MTTDTTAAPLSKPTAVRAAFRDALAALLLELGAASIPRQFRRDGVALLPARPDLLFTVQGPTNLTAGWVRVWDGHRAWVANLVDGARPGKPYTATH